MTTEEIDRLSIAVAKFAVDEDRDAMDQLLRLSELTPEEVDEVKWQALRDLASFAASYAAQLRRPLYREMREVMAARYPPA